MAKKKKHKNAPPEIGGAFGKAMKILIPRVKPKPKTPDNLKDE